MRANEVSQKVIMDKSGARKPASNRIIENRNIQRWNFRWLKLVF